MPMSPSALKQMMEPMILQKLTDAFPEVADYSEQSASLQKLAKAVAAGVSEAIIPYIVANAVVAPGIPVATAGSPAAQTGATTGTGVIL